LLWDRDPSTLFQPPTAHIYRCKTRTVQLAEKASLASTDDDDVKEPMSQCACPESVVNRPIRDNDSTARKRRGQKRGHRFVASRQRKDDPFHHESIPIHPPSLPSAHLFLPNKQSKILVTLFLPYPQRRCRHHLRNTPP